MNASIAPSVSPIEKTCRKCGALFSGEYCKACKKVYSAASRLENKQKNKEYYLSHRSANLERLKAEAAARYAANKEQAREKRALNAEANNAYQAAYRLAHPEKIKALAVSYYANNKEKIVEYRAENSEKIKASVAAYRENNREKVRAAVAKYVFENPGKVKENSKRYYAKNAKKINAYGSTYKAANIEKTRVYEKARRAANPEIERIKGNNRRARKAADGKRLSLGLSEKLFKMQKGKCACCGKPLGKYHLDHKIPLALGGKNEDSNMQLLLPRCNLQKGAKNPEDFMRSRGFLI